jgi:hypothetical protein
MKEDVNGVMALYKKDVTIFTMNGVCTLKDESPYISQIKCSNGLVLWPSRA